MKIGLGIGIIVVFAFLLVFLWANPQIIEEPKIKEFKQENRLAKNQTNIVVIMTDDLSVTMLDVLLENNMMPNLQEHIIDKGTTFTNSFVSDPLCCPSRATFLTGQYSHNHGVLTNKPIYINGELFDGGFEAFDDSSTVATWLKKIGYKTGFIGKYFNGYHRETTYIPPGWENWQAVTKGSNKMYNYTINDNGLEVKNIPDYKTDYIADRAVDFINESNSPFFLYVSTFVPHESRDSDGCNVGHTRGEFRSVVVFPKYDGTLDFISVPHHPSFNEKDVSDKPPSIRNESLIENINCVESIFRGRTESVRSVDDLIGDIYNALVNNNIQNNTVIMFTSDNGYMFGEHRGFAKSKPYEESIRVPLIILVPGLERQTLDHLVINNDLAPTIAEFSGAEPDIAVDGLSLLPILKDSSKKLRDVFLVETTSKKGYFFDSIRGMNFLYVEYGGNFNFIEYYDLNDDPYQLSNLAECTNQQCLEKIEQLSKLLDVLKECGDGTCQNDSNAFFNYVN